MTSDERVRMRATLQAALRRSLLPGASLEHPGRLPARSSVSGDLLARFRSELTALGGTVHEAPDLEAIVGIVTGIAARQDSRRALMWDEQWLPFRGLASALVAAGISVDTQGDDDLRSPDRRRELASAAVGITGADAALAETGSIVLVSGPGRGRLASLLPPFHVALLRRATLIDSLASLIAARPELITSGSNFVCITGPSRTGDIEMTLSRGVHGPKEVHVVVVD